MVTDLSHYTGSGSDPETRSIARIFMWIVLFSPFFSSAVILLVFAGIEINSLFFLVLLMGLGVIIYLILSYIAMYHNLDSDS